MHQRIRCDLCHFVGYLMCTFQRDGGCDKQTVVELRAGFDLLGIGNELVCQLFEQSRHRKQKDGTYDIEDRVCRCDTRIGGCFIEQYRRKDRLRNRKCDQTECRTDDVEGQVNESRSSCVLGRTDRGQQRGDTGTDVLSHDDRNCRTEGNRTGRRKCLQNTDRRGAGLDDRGQDRTDDDTENGILEHDEHFLECRNVFQSGNRIGHCFHTEHQRCKAEQNDTDILFLVALGEHDKNDADQRKNGCKGGRL